MNAERASVFLVDEERQQLVLRVAQDAEAIRIPIATGLAGAAATTGKAIRVADAHQDPRFNPDVDRRTDFRTRSVLCLPLHNTRGRVFAVTQLLNRRDGRPFDEHDEQRFTDFANSLGILLESLVGMARR